MLLLVQQLPLQLHWIFPSQTGSAVAHFPVGLVIGINFVLFNMESNTLLDSRYEALHSQIFNTVSTCNSISIKHKLLF